MSATLDPATFSGCDDVCIRCEPNWDKEIVADTMVMLIPVRLTLLERINQG
jgi:hypothetical protein